MADNQTPIKKVKVKAHSANTNNEQTEHNDSLQGDALYQYLVEIYKKWSSSGILALAITCAFIVVLYALLGTIGNFVAVLLILIAMCISVIPFYKYSKLLRNYGINSLNDKTAYAQIEKAAFGEVTGISEELYKPAPKPMPSARGTLLHIDGLGLPDGAKCKVDFQNGTLTVDALSQTITLAGEKIVGAEIVKKKDITKQAVSNAGGAIAGAMWFGALGAIVGGASHKKTVKQVHRFLVISYLADDGVKHIVFGANDGTFSADRTAAIRNAIAKYAKGRHVEIEL